MLRMRSVILSLLLISCRRLVDGRLVTREAEADGDTRLFTANNDDDDERFQFSSSSSSSSFPKVAFAAAQVALSDSAYSQPASQLIDRLVTSSDEEELQQTNLYDAEDEMEQINSNQRYVDGRRDRRVADDDNQLADEQGLPTWKKDYEEEQLNYRQLLRKRAHFDDIDRFQGDDLSTGMRPPGEIKSTL